MKSITYGAFACAVLAAGCATPQMNLDQARQWASGLSEWDTCYVSASPRFNGNAKQAAYETILRRRTDCAPHSPTVAARINADNQANQQQMATGLWLLNASRPQAAPMPRTTYCRTVWVGNGYNTVCD